jgi:hypothetical protein
VAPAVRPAPYRVTIRLPLADPSAPAEVVTKALRAAGVRVLEHHGSGLIHGYFGMGAASPAAGEESRRVRADMRMLLEG